jgi:hypothetical protein
MAPYMYTAVSYMYTMAPYTYTAVSYMYTTAPYMYTAVSYMYTTAPYMYTAVSYMYTTAPYTHTRCLCFFALTPSPSPTGWERGVGAHGGAPCSAFPLSRRRERGTKGVRAHRWVHGVQANKWCQVHFRWVRALPKLELSEEQIVELVRQLSPDAKRKVMQLLGSVPDHSAEPEASVGEFAQLPCFGMWADHEALQDSDAWVRKERERWHRRASRRD